MVFEYLDSRIPRRLAIGAKGEDIPPGDRLGQIEMEANGHQRGKNHRNGNDRHVAGAQPEEILGQPEDDLPLHQDHRHAVGDPHHSIGRHERRKSKNAYQHPVGKAKESADSKSAGDGRERSAFR